MSDGHDLSAGDRLDVADKRRDVVDPLRPRVDVTTLPWTFAVAAQVDGVGAHTEVRHSLCEPLITAGVLAKSVHDSERDSAGLRPGAIGELCTVGRLDRPGGCERALSPQDDPGL